MGRNGEMSTDLKILRTELSAQASTLLIFLIVSAAVLAMSLVVGMGTMIVPMAMITVAFLPMPMFARDDKGRMNTMYVILPVSRTRRVLARYLLLLGAAIVMTLAGLAVSVLIDPYATRYPYFDRPAMASLMGLTFAFMCFVTGVQLPLLFSFDFLKVGMFAACIPLLTVFGGSLLLQQYPRWISILLKPISDSCTGPLGLALGIVWMALSAVTSIFLYGRRDL